MLLAYLRDDEVKALRAALSEPLDAALVGRLERRARIRRRIGLVPFFDRNRPGLGARDYPCVKGHGPDYCSCLDEALDSGKRIATLGGLQYQASLFHNRRHPPQKPEPQWRPEPATVLPFSKRKPAAEPSVPDDPFRLDPVPDPVLDPALEQRAPLETLEQLAERLRVPLYPQPPEGSYRR